MTKRPRRNHRPAFEAKVAVAAITGEKTLAEALYRRPKTTKPAPGHKVRGTASGVSPVSCSLLDRHASIRQRPEISTEPRLQTATSSGPVSNVISVQRFEERATPTASPLSGGARGRRPGLTPESSPPGFHAVAAGLLARGVPFSPAFPAVGPVA